MAKATTKTPAKEEQKNVPAVVNHGSTAIPDHLREALAESTGLGVSTSQDDNIIPMVYLLQKGSPQVDERDDDYVDGAKPGEIWLKGSLNPIRSGSDGILFQPCAFEKFWVEWKPNRGGYVNRHKHCPADAEEITVKNDKGEDVQVWARPNKNQLVETRYHYGFVGAEPYVIPMSSTQHTVSRTWMSLMNQFKDARGNPLDSCAKLYRLTTVRREKDGNNWFVFKVDDGGWATVEQYRAGLAFGKAILAGEKRADIDGEAADADADDGSSVV